MKSPMERLRISMDLTIWDWAMVAEALDSYILKHMDDLDTSRLLEFLEHIEKRTGLNE